MKRPFNGVSLGRAKCQSPVLHQTYNSIQLKRIIDKDTGK